MAAREIQERDLLGEAVTLVVVLARDAIQTVSQPSPVPAMACEKSAAEP